MSFVAPGASNVFVPDHEASGRMVVDFSRDPKRFPLPRYCQYVPVKKSDGLYLEMTVEEAGRIINTDLSNFLWPDGLEAPASRDALEEFRFLSYKTKRYAYDFVLGDITIEQATWDVMKQHLDIKARQAMTARTVMALAVLTNTSLYSASHFSAVSSISGNTGNWAQSTTARQDIKRSLNHAASVIKDDTLAAVDNEDFQLVINDRLAAAMSQSQEIADYIKGSPEAYAYVKGDLAKQNRNVAFGLPPTLYGFDVVVEDTRRVTSRKGATKAVAPVMANDVAVLTSRVGELEGAEGAPSFSTLTLFVREEMSVAKKHDTDNRRTQGRVVDDMVPKLTAPSSGFVFTSCQ